MLADPLTFQLHIFGFTIISVSFKERDEPKTSNSASFWTAKLNARHRNTVRSVIKGIYRTPSGPEGQRRGGKRPSVRFL